MAAKEPKSIPVEPVEPSSSPIKDSDFGDSAIEDRIAVFWERNRAWILGAVAVGFFAVIAYNVALLVVENRESGLRQEFGDQEGIEALLTFAENHEGHRLAGTAYLKAAHEAYEAEDYETAITAYGEAVPRLTGTPPEARARLGRAMALVRSGATEEGQQLLLAIAENGGYLDAIRAEAAFHLIHLYWEDENYEAIAREVARVDSFEEAFAWGQRVQSLNRQIPELAEFEPTPEEISF